jgi:tetratricopeptide (TPR) repeat protein
MEPSLLGRAGWGRLFLLIALQFSLFVMVDAQPGRDETLANSYFEEGEIDKAAELYQSLWEKSNYDLKFYTPLYKCLLSLKKYDDLEKVVKKEVKKNNDAAQFVIDLGYLYSQMADAARAKEQFDKALKDVKPYEVNIRNLANIYEAYRLYDYVIATYEKGGKAFKNDSYYSMELANAYMNKGDAATAVKYFLINLEANPQNEQIIKNTVQTNGSEAK